MEDLPICGEWLVICVLMALALAPKALFAQCLPVQQQKLLANDGAQGDEFGSAAAISGDTAVIGAWNVDTAAGNFAGAAYAFVRSAGVWAQQAKLISNDVLDGTNDHLGTSVAIDGDTAVAGAWTDNNSRGSAYVFVRSGTVWSQQAKLTADDASNGDQFGVSVAVSGNTIVVGAFRDTGVGAQSGSAYVFVRSGTVWTQQAHLVPVDLQAGDNFGISVAVSGDTALIGSASDDIGPAQDKGSAYVYVRTGTSWTQQQKLNGSDSVAFDSFGSAVAVSGDTALVGSPNADLGGGFGQGAAYVFIRSGTIWFQQAKLSSPGDEAADNYAGTSVALSPSGDLAAMGNPYNDNANGIGAGAVYFFTRSGTTWTLQPKLTANDGTTNDNLGYSVAASNDTVIGGALLDNTIGGTTAGSAYVFLTNCGVPCCAGDFTADHLVSLSDIPGFVGALLGGGSCGSGCCAGDMNGDTLIDGADIRNFVNRVLTGGTCP